MATSSACEFGEDTNDVIVAQLECPVCLNRCTKPIFMCPNGHNVCSKCQPGLKSCPVCRVPGRPTNRNLFAEEIGQTALVPCNNADQGCNKVLKLKEIPEHLQICDFGLKCVFEDCDWRGSKASLTEHALMDHPEYVFQVGKDGVKLLNDNFECDCTKSRKICGLPILRTAMLIFEQDSFWYMSKQTGNSKFQVQIRLIDNSDCVPAQSYQLMFRSTDSSGIRTLRYKNNVRALTAGAFTDIVFEEDDNKRRYLNGNELSFVLKMYGMPQDTKVTLSYKPKEYNPQIRKRPLTNWEDFEYIELGRERNEKILAKKVCYDDDDDDDYYDDYYDGGTYDGNY